MARIWANRLEAGTQKWENCPESRYESVKKILQEDVKDNIITAERYQEICGEVYPEKMEDFLK